MGLMAPGDILADCDKYERHLVVYIASDRDPVPDSEVELVDYEGPHMPGFQSQEAKRS